MINCSTDRGKYIIRKNPGDNIDEIQYTVYINNSSAIFQGASRYFGGTYEVDCSDWIEQWISKQTNEGNNPIYCRVYVVFRFLSNGVVQSQQGGTVYWYPDTIEKEVPSQKGMICGGANGFPGAYSIGDWEGYAATVGIYPLYFFKLSCKIDGNDYSDDNVMWDPSGPDEVLLEPGDSQFKFTVFDNSTELPSGSGWDVVNNYLVKNYNPVTIYYQMYDLFGGPRLTLHRPDGEVDSIKFVELYAETPLTMPIINALYSVQYDPYDDADASSDMWGHNSFIRYNETTLRNYYNTYVATYINKLISANLYTLSDSSEMTDIRLELVGFGYKTMMLYNTAEGLPDLDEDSGVFTSDYCSCYRPSDCPTANLVLVNSGFAKTGNDTYVTKVTWDNEFQDADDPYDIVIPLMVRGGILVGKTTNNLDKTTYMDRYGDYHNSIMTNKYELECYVDPDWLSVRSGQDLDYEKLMLAMQNAQKSYLASDVPVSGIESEGGFMMEGRVKDIEQVETYSSYSINKRIPTYKIVFEVYR